MANKVTDISTKRVKLDKAQATTAAVIAIAAFIIVFSLFAIKSLISQYQYQAKVTTAQGATLDKLSSDKAAAAQLVSSFKTFVQKSKNIIGGSSTGTGSQDGNNAKIILDALPDSYDFPAMVSSVGSILSANGLTILSVGGTDTSGASVVASTATTTATTPTTKSKNAPIPMPFSVSVTGSYQQVQGLINSFENSIRPISIRTINLTGTDSSLTANITAITYYQNSSGLNVSTETIK